MSIASSRHRDLVEFSAVRIAATFAVNWSEEDICGTSLEGGNPAELNNDGMRFLAKIMQGRQMQRAQNIQPL